MTQNKPGGHEPPLTTPGISVENAGMARTDRSNWTIYVPDDVRDRAVINSKKWAAHMGLSPSSRGHASPYVSWALIKMDEFMRRCAEAGIHPEAAWREMMDDE